MKQLINNVLKGIKSVKGNSLAEFATTTALMATLAATAAPKLSEMSEGAKGEKSRNEIDKIIKQAGQFYQDTADLEGRGRFPNQAKFNVSIGGATEAGHSNGGDGVYGAWKLTYLEPMFVNMNLLGRERFISDENKAKYKVGCCPKAENLQPKLLQFKTNYWDINRAYEQAEILVKTLTELAVNI